MIDSMIQQYGKRLYGLCLHLCGNSFDADDLYQETWLRALQGLSRYDPARSPEPWLTRICVNCYRSRLRQLARSPVLRFADGDEQERILLETPAPEEADDSYLREAVDRLPPRLRTTVILYYFRGLDIAAAAKALGVPAGTVKSRLNKARNLLREVLTHETNLPF